MAFQTKQFAFPHQIGEMMEDASGNLPSPIALTVPYSLPEGNGRPICLSGFQEEKTYSIEKYYNL